MVLVLWDEPDEGEDVLKVEIYSSATESGSYTLLSTIDAKDGDDAWVLEYEDSTGTSTTWYKIRFLNTALTASEYSTARQCSYNVLTYTTVELVKAIIPNVTVNSTDTEIRKAILDAESYIDSQLKTSFKSGYDPTTKHGVIRTLCSKIAVINCLEDDIVSSLGSNLGAILIDSLNQDIENIFEGLQDKAKKNYLSSL